MLLLASLAAAHPDASPHAHAPAPGGLLLLGAWLVAAVLVWRVARTFGDDATPAQPAR